MARRGAPEKGHVAIPFHDPLVRLMDWSSAYGSGAEVAPPPRTFVRLAWMETVRAEVRPPPGKETLAFPA